jgi:hypothetical protein
VSASDVRSQERDAVEVAARTDARWPNLFVVGAPKAGTTSLWQHLDRHPDIWMAPVKEPQYFSGVWYDEPSYLRLFEPGMRFGLRGEASPTYLAAPGVAERIKHASPDARIVIMLRDPVDRAYSKYSQEANRAAETRSFAAAVEEQIREPAPDGRPSAYVGSSLYADAVARYLGTFGSQVHVIVFEEFARDTRAEVRKLFAFLDVDPDVADRLDVTATNTFAVPRSSVGEFVQHSRRIRTTARRVTPRRVYSLGRRLLLKSAHKPPLDSEVDARLTEYFRPDVERLQGVLGRELPWRRFTRDAAA